ncbi:MAG: response regulator [Acidobacteriia bacterium]|nr:response regulator [Terriglobia bacterium]
MPFTVLIVDDSPVMRTFIRRVINLAGYADATFVEASDGREALARLEDCSPDVILTDINMPGMGGEELLQELERNGTLHTTPALVISTDATRDRLHRMMHLGARGYLAKPFLPEDLRRELERVLGANHASAE